MKRRALLVALAPLTAGCFGGTRAESDEPAQSSGQAANGTPAPTPTEKPTPTPTETPTETPEKELSGDRKEAIDSIHSAQNRFKDAVYIYTGGVSNDLTDVSADTDEFEDRSILLKLSKVRTATDEAQRAAVTGDQKQTVESLRELQQFLTQATDLQAWLIEGHEAVAEAYDAIDDDDDDGTVETELDALERAVNSTSDPLETVAAVDPAVAESTDAITVDEFEKKQTQFDDETDVLEQLHDALSTIQSKRDELDAARAKADNGDYYSAEKAAGRAADTLYETVRELEELDDSPPARAGAFEDQIEDTLVLAEDYEAEAEDLQDQYD